MYFVKSKNGTKCKNFASFYVNTFTLLYFLRFQERGAVAPLATPLNPLLIYLQYSAFHELNYLRINFTQFS